MEIQLGKFYKLVGNTKDPKNSSYSIVKCLNYHQESNELSSLEIYHNNGDGIFIASKTPCYVPFKFSTGLASSEEIEECLVAYAKANGYVDGVTVFGLATHEEIVLNGNYRFYQVNNTLAIADTIIYSDGEWVNLVEKGIDNIPLSIPEKCDIMINKIIELKKFNNLLKLASRYDFIPYLDDLEEDEEMELFGLSKEDITPYHGNSESEIQQILIRTIDGL